MKPLLISSLLLFSSACAYANHKKISTKHKFRSTQLMDNLESSNSTLENFNITNELQEFTSDGCSSFPDGTVFTPNKWQHCCVQHDIAYWAGGINLERINADKELRACVSEIAGSFLGFTMYEGVRIGGSPFLTTNWRWGYGWKYKRGYRPLNEVEKKAVDEMIPTNIEDIIVTNPIKNYFRLPSPTGNYCADEAVSIVKEKFGESVVIEDIVFSGLLKHNGFQKTNTNKSIIVRISDCDSPIKFSLKRMNIRHCIKSIYDEIAPKFIKEVTIPKSCKSKVENELGL